MLKSDSKKLKRTFGFLILLFLLSGLNFGQQKRETTIRNATKESITYSIRFYRSDQKREEKILKMDEIHRYPGHLAPYITFPHGEKRITYRIAPGQPYVFRFDELNQLELFLGSHGRADAVDLAPYVVTPYVVIEKMLEMAAVNKDDLVYDIGCGDGRIVIAAAEIYGARGVGIDIIPKRIQESRENARASIVEHLVEFRLEDATKSDISKATVVTLYLIPDSNALLRPLFEKQLKPGTRVISHGYPIIGWEDKLVEFAKVETEFESAHLIFAYKR